MQNLSTPPRGAVCVPISRCRLHNNAFRFTRRLLRLVPEYSITNTDIHASVFRSFSARRVLSNTKEGTSTSLQSSVNPKLGFLLIMYVFPPVFKLCRRGAPPRKLAIPPVAGAPKQAPRIPGAELEKP